MSTCPPDDVLRRVVEQTLSEDEILLIDEHIRFCPCCFKRLDRLAREAPLGQHATLTQETATSVPDELPRIPDFLLEGRLGRGSNGIVYLARKETLQDRPVALKVIPVAPGPSDEARRLWQHEARAFSLARHPQVVTLYEAGEGSSWFFLVLEYIPGGSLQARLDGPVPARDAAELVARIADGLEAIHQAGLVHLDLKPANVLIDSLPGVPLGQANPRVTDFGIARSLTELTLSGSANPRKAHWGGTPPYMAPEQLAGTRKELGPASDIHALGAILYQLLTGRPPFQSPTMPDLVDQVMTREPVPPRRLVPQIPRDLETITLKCLQKSPGRRYPSAQALADDLRRWLSGHPIQARPVSKPDQIWRACRRRPDVGSLVAALVVVIVAGYALLYRAYRNVDEQRLAARSAQKSAGENRDAVLAVTARLEERMLGAVTLPQ
jgi:serine/threonine protein kinase